MVVTMQDPEKFHAEMKARQENVFWPGPIRNIRFVYDFLWNGSPNATLALRIGAFLLGLAYLASSCAGLYYSFGDGSLLALLYSFGFLLVGVRVLYKALHKQPKPSLPRV
jgi:hypothetical protein